MDHGTWVAKKDNIPVLLFDAFSMHTRLRSTVVGPGEAQRAMGGGRAQTVEPIDFVHTGSPAHTRVWVTLVDLHVTFNPFWRVIQIHSGFIVKLVFSDRIKSWAVLLYIFINLILPHFWNILQHYNVDFNGSYLYILGRTHICTR